MKDTIISFSNPLKFSTVEINKQSKLLNTVVVFKISERYPFDNNVSLDFLLFHHFV